MEEMNFVVTFKKPVTWEEKTYTQVDFSDIELLSAKDLEDVYRDYAASAGVGLASLPEFSPEYCCLLAAKATKLPVEFFLSMPPKANMQIRNFIRNYFFIED